MQHVLVTGAAGGIGSRLRKLLKGVYPHIRWSDIKIPADLGADEEFVQADIADYAAVEQLTNGIDGIVHLGGHSIEGPWETILSANIIGCRNLFEAAYRSGVKRVVFASSNHAVGFYPRSQKIGVSASIRAARRSASTSRCARTPAMASARRSGKRSVRSMPTSTACG
jgi:uronate dehydrogenase